jgi:long-chain fatty acid transport protein
MTRLEDADPAGSPAVVRNLSFTIGPGTSAALGTNGGSPVGWFPAGHVLHLQRLERLEARWRRRNLWFGEEYRLWLGDRYYNQSATLLGISLLPSIAYRLNDKFSVGLAVNVMYGVLKEHVAINNRGSGPDGDLRLDANAWGAGVNLGVLYELSPETRFGLTYNSRVKLGFSAPAQFTGISSGL